MSSAESNDKKRSVDNNESAPDNPAASKKAADGEPVRSKKIALLFGYKGSEYQGLQVNPTAHSIEKVLYAALISVGAVRPDASMFDVKWMRCARTDKGVHASGNVVSFYCRLVEQLVEKLNAALPDDIRVFGYRHVTNGFHCKNQCDQRTYEFCIPSFCFLTPAPPLEQCELRYAYRIDAATLARFRSTLQLFKGTHNFHNYTKGKRADDPSARRHMRSLSVAPPLLVDNIEMLRITIVGQSFMLHQIRKMTATVIWLMRAGLPEASIKRTLTAERINLPLIPGIGLALRRCWFTSYANTVAKRAKELPFRASLEWQAEQAAQEQFMETQIVPHVAALERGTYQAQQKALNVASNVKCTSAHSFAKFMHTADFYPPDRAVLTLHRLLRPQRGVAVLGSSTQLQAAFALRVPMPVLANFAAVAQREQLQVNETVIALFFDAPIESTPDGKRCKVAPVKARGLALLGAADMNKPLQVKMMPSNGKPEVLLAEFSSSAPWHTFEAQLPHATTSLTLNETVNILGRTVQLTTKENAPLHSAQIGARTKLRIDTYFEGNLKPAEEFPKFN